MSARRPDPRALVRKRAAATRRGVNGDGSGAGVGNGAAGGSGGGGGGDGSPSGRMVYPVHRSASSEDDVAMLTEVVRRLEDDNSRLKYDLHVAKQQTQDVAGGGQGLGLMADRDGAAMALMLQVKQARAEARAATKALDAQRARAEAAIADVKGQMAGKQVEWEVALEAAKEQIATATRERDAVLAYATDLERQLKQSRQSDAVRRIVACLTAVRVRTISGAFAHWCSQINRHIAADITMRAKDVDMQYRKGKEELKLLAQQQQHAQVAMQNLHNELVDTRGHVSELQAALSSSRAAYTQVTASETALRLRVEQLQEAKNELDSETRIMTERVQGLERELNSREVMLRQRENRLVNAEEQLGALTAELQGLKVKLKSVRSEAQGREENIRSALTSLANAKAENIELKGELAALREGEKSIAAQELQLQARLEEVLAREESMRDRERDVEEQARSMEEVTAARERVLRARELLLQQGEKTRKQEALRLADSQRQLGPVQSLHQRATSAESMVAVLQGEKADLQARVDELVRALRDERTKRSLQELAGSGDEPLSPGSFPSTAQREKAFVGRESDLTLQAAQVGQLEARLRAKEQRLDAMLTAAERSKHALEAQLIRRSQDVAATGSAGTTAAATTTAAAPTVTSASGSGAGAGSPTMTTTTSAASAGGSGGLRRVPSWAAHMSPAAQRAIARASPGIGLAKLQPADTGTDGSSMGQAGQGRTVNGHGDGGTAVDGASPTSTPAVPLGGYSKIGRVRAAEGTAPPTPGPALSPQSRSAQPSAAASSAGGR